MARKPGLNEVINDFFDADPQWCSMERHKNNNGLTLLTRANRRFHESLGSCTAEEKP